uniref:Uncharacterized protein n=1 Tax=Arundo donax TaxID=35708 RepID=A0A0A9C436_ARUDO
MRRRNSRGGIIIKKRKMSNMQQGVFQETTCITQQEVPRDKTTRHKAPDYMRPPIKVG